MSKDEKLPVDKKLAKTIMGSIARNSDVARPDNGREDLGDSRYINIQKILDEEREDVRDCYVIWEKRDIVSPKGQEYSPVVKVVGIGEVYGRWRVGQNFIFGEREMLTQAITNQLSQLIWGVDMFVEKAAPSGVKFKINPKFRKLPCINPPKNLEDIADASFESVLPLTVVDNEGNEKRIYAVTEITSWNAETEMPHMIEVIRYDDRKEHTTQLYHPVDAEPMIKPTEDEPEESKVIKQSNGLTIM